MRRSLLALCAAAVVLAGGCGSAHKVSAPPTTPVATSPIPSSTSRPSRTAQRSTTTPSTTDPTTTTTVPPTTTAPDTSVVPRRITVAYVDAVLAKLNHVYGDAVRSLVANKRLTVGAYKDLADIYTSSLAAEEQKIFIEQSSAKYLKIARRHPGDPITRVIRIIHSSNSCIFSRVFTNTNPETVHPTKPPADEYIGLKRNIDGPTPTLNHTPWIIFFDGVNRRFTLIPNQCPRD